MIRERKRRVANRAKYIYTFDHIPTLNTKSRETKIIS